MNFLLLLVLFIGIYAALDYAKPQMMASFEENAVAFILASITIISFAQVVMRYGFNSGFAGALELTTVLFAWLILFGMSYGIRENMHLGVDAVINFFPPKAFKIVACFGALCCILYGVILINADWLKPLGATTRGGGAIDYWSKMYKLGIGMEDMRYPGFLTEMFDLPERTQRWVAYLILPMGLGLFVFRSTQALIDLIRGDRRLIIAGHEAEELVADNKDALKD